MLGLNFRLLNRNKCVSKNQQRFVVELLRIH